MTDGTIKKLRVWVALKLLRAARDITPPDKRRKVSYQTMAAAAVLTSPPQTARQAT